MNWFFLGAPNQRFGAWMSLLWQATGSPNSRRSARSGARTNGLDFGVAAATPRPRVVEAGDEASERSARDVARWLGTSPTQLYRLLDPTNYAKSLLRLISLLYLLGAEFEVEVKDRPRRRAG